VRQSKLCAALKTGMRSSCALPPGQSVLSKHRAVEQGCLTWLTIMSVGIPLSAAQGTGITDRDARQNVMRHTTQKLRSVLGGERSEYHSDWLTSNRSADQQWNGNQLQPASCLGHAQAVWRHWCWA
jgi:hypothetical protein